MMGKEAGLVTPLVLLLIDLGDPDGQGPGRPLVGRPGRRSGLPSPAGRGGREVCCALANGALRVAGCAPAGRCW